MTRRLNVLKHSFVLCLILGISNQAFAAVLLTSCGTLNQPNTVYELQDDVSTIGTCFTTTAQNITLDLKGKKITYGTSSSQASYGVSVDGNNSGGLIIRNGTIEQGSNAASFSHAISLTEGMLGTQGAEIYNMTISVHSTASVNINVVRCKNIHIHDNILKSFVTRINNRHALEGYVVRLIDIDDVANHRIYGNKIIGGAQGGIYLSGKQNKIYKNDIQSGGGDLGYTNNFCIQGYGMSESEIYENYCHPVQGRGIFINGNNMKVYNNTVDVFELSNNQEYNGCPLGGAYGIQLEGPSRNSLVFNNTVTARAVDCPGKALRLTEIEPDSNNHVYNNTFVGKRTGTGSGRAIAISSGGGLGAVLLENNTFIADTMHLEVDWDGLQGLIMKGNRFIKGANPATSYRTFHFENSVSSTGNVVIDGIFENGADASSFRMINIGSGDWAGASEYVVQWSLSLIVNNVQGQPLSQANVVIKDAKNQQVYSGQTDALGKISVPLNAFRKFNTTSSAIGNEILTPHVVTVSKTGLNIWTSSVDMDATKNITVLLTDSSPPIDSKLPSAPSNLRIY